MEDKKMRQMSETFRLGALLALAGGFLDAYTYLVRGGVFANAQTGNLVLLGVSLAEGRLERAVHYLIPVLAFAGGVVVAELLKRRGRRRDAGLHWRQTVLAAELLLLILVAFLPQQLNALANVLVSFICAMQVESFRKVNGNAFATTMCTGNLRSGTERLFLYFTTGEADHRHRAGQYYGIILCFVAGAALGALVSGWLGIRSVLAAGVFLLAAFLLMFRVESSCTGE